MLNGFLNKGAAGKSITRRETAERVSRLMQQHTNLLHAYQYAMAHAPSKEFAHGLDLLQKRSRNDVSKMSELVLSAGHAPPPRAPMLNRVR